MASLSKAGKAKVLIWEAQYMVGKEPSGALLLKVIIRESHIDSNAMTAMIRTKLSSLDTYIVTIASDITEFNQYGKLLVQLLHTRGETTTDLLTNLFKGYAAASDQVFRSYIERKLETWEESGGDDDTMSADALMALANENFKIMKNKGTWNDPSANEEKITALSAKVAKLTPSSNRGGKAVSFVKEKKRTTSTKSSKEKTPRGRKQKPDFLQKRPPEADLKKVKNWNGAEWRYCHPDTGGKCNGEWRTHLPFACEGKAFKPEKKRVHADDQEGEKNGDQTGQGLPGDP
jgi:hypothetical protein